MSGLNDPSGLTRRAVLSGMAGAGTVALSASGESTSTAGNAKPQRASETRWDVIVVGAGVFGAWTAWNLRREGRSVLLVDAWGPAHARASSGGESRMTRTAYGSDDLYARWAWESLEDWKWLSQRSGLPILHQIGVLFFFAKAEPYYVQSVEAHRRLKIPLVELDRAALLRQYPQVSWDGIERGLFEPSLGVLMARRAVQTLVKEFVNAGGRYELMAIKAPAAGKTLASVETLGGVTLRAQQFVFACGPWLPKLFPEVLGARIFPTRQEVFFFAPPSGDTSFEPARMPGWADFNGGDIYYGMPDLEARGFKVAHDQHGVAIDPDRGDRSASAAGLAEVRTYMERRFPAMKGRPLVESRVCQYENSSNGDLLIDRHPAIDNVWLVGAGSGHGFKHGPAIGRYTAGLVTGKSRVTEPRLSLASKAEQQHRAVH